MMQRGRGAARSHARACARRHTHPHKNTHKNARPQSHMQTATRKPHATPSHTLICPSQLPGSEMVIDVAPGVDVRACVRACMCSCICMCVLGGTQAPQVRGWRAAERRAQPTGRAHGFLYALARPRLPFPSGLARSPPPSTRSSNPRTPPLDMAARRVAAQWTAMVAIIMALRQARTCMR
jgi:hypothetical protein